MPRQISVRLKLTKCMTNHQKWACTAEMFPAGAAPLWLATFSEPLGKIRCYNPLGKLQLCVDLWKQKKKISLSYRHCQITPAAFLSTHLHPPGGLHDNLGCGKNWRKPAAPAGVVWFFLLWKHNILQTKTSNWLGHSGKLPTGIVWTWWNTWNNITEVVRIA